MTAKIFLTTTALTITTTAAFGAASLRVPQSGGATATQATPVAPVRAGTLRAQTLKAPSATTPATVTAPMATPISAESTESRMALSKAFKSLNPKQVKDKAAAQQDLVELTSQIEELQAKLDTAKIEQTTVLTESNIDDKIIANVESKTYTKEEINTLLGSLENKLPKIDDRGNINLTDPNGTLVSVPRYHFIPSGVYNEPLSTRYGFQTNAPDDKINEFVANFCHGQSEVWCSKESVNQSHNGGEPTLWILVREHGYESLSSWFSTLGSYTIYATNEDDPVAYVLDKICKDYSSEDCYAVGYIDQSDDPTVTPRYRVSIFKKLISETELPAPLVE